MPNEPIREGEAPAEPRRWRLSQKLIPKRQKRFAGLDEKIITLYARGMSVRDIQDNLEELYGTEVLEGLISEAADAVLDEVKAWQSRPLDAVFTTGNVLHHTI